MYNIIALFGRAGSGKDTILRCVSEKMPELNKIVSCTSRAPREKEEDGRDYHFLSPLYFEQNKSEFIETAQFNNWWYGTRLIDLKPDPITNIGVFSISAINQILMAKKNVEINVYPIKLVVSGRDSLIHQLKREENPNINEIFRRYNADEKDFSNIPFRHQIIYNHEGNLYDTVLTVTDLINSYTQIL